MTAAKASRERQRVRRIEAHPPRRGAQQEAQAADGDDHRQAPADLRARRPRSRRRPTRITTTTSSTSPPMAVSTPERLERRMWIARTIIAGSCSRRPSRLPAAVILLVGGLISCFAGYRVFRVVLGIYGFIIGALFASGIVGPENTVWMIARRARRRHRRRADPDRRLLRRRRAARRRHRRARRQPDLGVARPRAGRARRDRVRRSPARSARSRCSAT